MVEVLYYDILYLIASYLALTDLDCFRWCHAAFWDAWIDRQYRFYSVREELDLQQLLTHLCKYKGVGKRVNTLSIYFDRRVQLRASSIIGIISKLPAIIDLRLLWDGCANPHSEGIAAFFSPIATHQMCQTLACISLSAPIEILHVIAICHFPRLKSFSFTFHTGFVPQRTIEKGLAHLTTFLNGSCQTLQVLSIGVDSSSMNLDIGHLFQLLGGKFCKLESLAILIPSPGDLHDGNQTNFPAIRRFVTKHSHQLVKITFKGGQQGCRLIRSNSSHFHWPQFVMDDMQFESLKELDIGLVPFDWLAPFLRQHHSTLQSIILSENGFDLIDFRRHISSGLPPPEAALTFSPNQLTLSITGLTPGVLADLAYCFPTVKHLWVKFWDAFPTDFRCGLERFLTASLARETCLRNWQVRTIVLQNLNPWTFGAQPLLMEDFQQVMRSYLSEGIVVHDASFQT